MQSLKTSLYLLSPTSVVRVPNPHSDRHPLDPRSPSYLYHHCFAPLIIRRPLPIRRRMLITSLVNMTSCPWPTTKVDVWHSTTTICAKTSLAMFDSPDAWSSVSLVLHSRKYVHTIVVVVSLFKVNDDQQVTTEHGSEWPKLAQYNYKYKQIHWQVLRI